MGTLYRITTVKKIVETLFYPFISQKNNNPHVQKYLNIRPVEAELLAIAVDNRMRGQGVGKSLVKAFEKYLNHNGVNDYKVVTFNKDTSSNLFYKALGFVENRNFLHHGNTMNEYVKKITPDQNHNE
jgi:ribosomal protein S18 acetylase RimI-like enzyme